MSNYDKHKGKDVEIDKIVSHLSQILRKRNSKLNEKSH